MDIGWLITAAILALDAIISIWNSYVAGKVSNETKALGILFYILGGLLPMTYVMSIVITILLAMFGYISYATVNFLLNFIFIFFGAAIIMWGVIATVTSIIATVKTRSWKAGLVSVYNIGALIYDMWEYVSDFGDAVKDMVSDLADDKEGAIAALIIVLGLALAISFIITYLAYKAGKGE